MILPDTNVWMALALSKHVFHSAATEWFASQTRKDSVLWCRSTQQSVLRLLTTEPVMRLYNLPAMSNANAWQLMDGYRADVPIGWANEPSGVESQWKKFAARNTPSPKLWMDAYLAAFAVSAGHRLITTDKAFTQFKDLDVTVLSPK